MNIVLCGYKLCLRCRESKNYFLLGKNMYVFLDLEVNLNSFLRFRFYLLSWVILFELLKFFYYRY